MLNAPVAPRSAVICLVAASLLVTGDAAVAAEPTRGPTAAVTPFFVKSAASLAELEKTLEGKGAHGATLLNPGASPLEIVWRHEEDYEQAEVEVHDRKEHVFFVTEGQATFTLGGQLVAPREISPGEWKAQSSRSSQTIEVQKGDLIFIPSGTVHSRSAKGRRFTMLQLSFWPRGLLPPRPPAPPAAHAPSPVPPKPAGLPAPRAQPPLPKPAHP
jgi:quercetin dioxygenase-like cupin family protein